MELSLDCTLDEAILPTSVSAKIPSLKRQCKDKGNLGGSKLNPASFFAWSVLAASLFHSGELNSTVHCWFFWPARKSRWRTLFESQNAVAIIIPAKKIVFTFFGGGGGGMEKGCVSTTLLTCFLIQEWSSGPRSHHRSQLSPKIPLLLSRTLIKVE
jgi:hypothetical protein